MTNWIVKALLFASLTAGSLVYAQDSVMTLAGQALVSGGTNGIGTNALFNDPAGMVSDSVGNLYIADSQNHVIRKLDTNGVVSTFAGQMGIAGSNDGTGTQAQFNTPSGIAIDSTGNLFVSDTGNHTIRKITPGGGVSTFAGLAGQSGFTDDIGAAARFNSPLGIAVATNGVIYVADSGNHLIRAVSNGGAVTTLAGTPETWGTNDGVGAAARFNGPVGLALDDAGNLFVSDSNNQTIRKTTPAGAVTTWAGSAGMDGCVNGDRLTARFAKPAELAFDGHGDLFVADSFNHAIRRISREGVVSTLTGAVSESGSVDGINGNARLFNPYGLAAVPDGSLTVADAYNQMIRLIFVPFSVKIDVTETNTLTRLSWDSVIRKKYRVQFKSMLGSGAWSNAGPAITATSLTTTATDAFGLATQRMYRVLVLP